MVAKEEQSKNLPFYVATINSTIRVMPVKILTVPISQFVPLKEKSVSKKFP